MSGPLLTLPGVRELSQRVIDALLLDEGNGGYDLAAGLFGPAFSALVVELAGRTATPPPPPPEYKTDQQIVDACNELARTFYEMQGCRVPDGYKFNEATHPAEEGCWNMAMVAYDHIEGTDVSACLDELDEEA